MICSAPQAPGVLAQSILSASTGVHAVAPLAGLVETSTSPSLAPAAAQNVVVEQDTLSISPMPLTVSVLHVPEAGSLEVRIVFWSLTATQSDVDGQATSRMYSAVARVVVHCPVSGALEASNCSGGSITKHSEGEAHAILSRKCDAI
jgi:hypothetical protein